MKVLLVHNYYRTGAPSGENAVFDAEAALLSARGVDVGRYTVQNDDLDARGTFGWLRGGFGRLRGALATPWNPLHRRRLRRLVAREQPDVVHVHNTFPRLSPAVLGAARQGGAAVVLTVHNFRMLCANGLFLRDGRPCTRCRDAQSVSPALRYGCYRGSRLATVPLAAMIALHRRRGTLARSVDAFICLTPFQRAQFVAAGWPPERLFVKPNFREAPAAPLARAEREDRAVYLGRFSPEKGLDLLIEAWRLWGAAAPPLTLVGDGPERARLEALAERHGLARRITFTGRLPAAEAQAVLARARLLVFPTRCFEGFPMAVVEAMAAGVPVVASDLGSLPDVIEDGLTGRLVPGNRPEAWREVLAVAWSDPEGLHRMGARARTVFDARYTAAANYESLLGIYGQAIRRRAESLASAKGTAQQPKHHHE